MNSQNRMNAGGEYVAYRIWATLQDEDGVHSGSLLACLGALAGYACQASVRQSAALPAADPRKFALSILAGADGNTYVSGDALNGPLIDSPLSVWSLVSRAVQKVDAPLPDIQGILRNTTETVGTRGFGMPRVPDEHRPTHKAAVYLKYIWPQILPIAQRFCRKPMQMPVLFGIAIQRAIEQTQSRLNPTLAAAIAMECAVAASRVVLHGADEKPVVPMPEVSTPLPAANEIKKEIKIESKPLASLARATMSESLPVRVPPPRKRKTVEPVETMRSRIWSVIATAPPTMRIAAVAALGILTVGIVRYEGGSGSEGPQTAQQQVAPRKLQVGMNMGGDESSSEEAAPPVEDVPLPMPEQGVAATPQANYEVEETLRPAPDTAVADGSSEIVMDDGAYAMDAAPRGNPDGPTPITD